MAELIHEEESLNKGRIKINKAINQSGRSERDAASALAKSLSAEQISLLAQAMSEQTQKQLDNVIIESGTSDAEVIQARGEEPILNDRLNKTDAQINKNEFELSNVKRTTKLVEKLGFKYAFSIHPSEWKIDYEGNNFKPSHSQSMVMTEENIYFTISQSPSTSPIGLLVEIDRETLKLKRHLFAEIFHSNGMAYCDEYEGKEVLVIAHLWDTVDNKSDKITIIDIETLSVIDVVSLGTSTRSISFDVDEEIFIAVSSEERVFYDKGFNELNRISVPRLATSQANLAYKGYNIVPYVHPDSLSIEDYSGNTLKRYRVNRDVYGEIEAIYPNGFGGLIGISNFGGFPTPFKFWEVDVIKTPNVLPVDALVDKPANVIGASSKEKSIYVDVNYVGISDGSEIRPFKKIEDALNVVYNRGNYRIILATGIYEETVKISNYNGTLTVVGNKSDIHSLTAENISGQLRFSGDLTFYGSELTNVGGSHTCAVAFRGVKSFHFFGGVKFDGEGTYGLRCFHSSGMIASGIEVKGYDVPFGGEFNSRITLLGKGIFDFESRVLESKHGTIFYIDSTMEKSINNNYLITNGGRIMKESQVAVERRYGETTVRNLTKDKVSSKEVLFDPPLKGNPSVILTVNTPFPDIAFASYTHAGMGGEGFELHVKRKDEASTLTVSWVAFSKV